MFKNGYKIIFIKEGKFDLKQFTISPLQVGLFAGAIILLTSSFFFMFSDQFVEWAGSHEIERHRKNNKVLVQNIEDNHKRIGNLLDELNELKKQDDVLRRLVKLPPIHDDIRKMGFGGTHNKTETEDVNYLLPEDHIDVEKMIDDINYVNRLINLERLSYNEITDNVESNKDKILSYPAIYPVKSGNKDLSSRIQIRPVGVVVDRCTCAVVLTGCRYPVWFAKPVTVMRHGFLGKARQGLGRSPAGQRVIEKSYR